MILDKLAINRKHNWRDNSYHYSGTASFVGKEHNVEINITETFCRKVIELAADSILDAAKEVSEMIKNEILDVKSTALLEVK